MDDLEQALRMHAFDDCGGIECPTHIANIAADRLRAYREALDAIVHVKPSRVADGFVTGPLTMLNQAQDIARRALQVKP